MYTIHIQPARTDNYIFIIENLNTKNAIIIDPASAEEANLKIKEKGLLPKYILNTHHHFDHVGGNLELKQQYNCQIYGAKNDLSRIPGIDVTLVDGETFTIEGLTINILETPGHTSGHIVYWIPELNAAFVGDTLFAMGCGRLFEGTPAQMWNSLCKIKKLPESCLLYCTHEYTLSNAEFAISLEPQNEAVLERKAICLAMRKQNQPTIPTQLKVELETNPFLRCDNENFKASQNLSDQEPSKVLGIIRELKDNF